MRLILFLILATAATAADSNPCVFCEIIAGTRQQEGVVHQDDKCVAFLSLGQRTPGHVLIVPRVHADNFMEVPADTMHAMTDAARMIVDAIRRTDLKCEGFVLQMNSGKAAGQSVFHAHLHIIPRFEGDGFNLPRTGEGFVPMSVLAPVAAKIRAELGKKGAAGGRR